MFTNPLASGLTTHTREQLVTHDGGQQWKIPPYIWKPISIYLLSGLCTLYLLSSPNQILKPILLCREICDARPGAEVAEWEPSEGRWHQWRHHRRRACHPQRGHQEASWVLQVIRMTKQRQPGCQDDCEQVEIFVKCDLMWKSKSFKAARQQSDCRPGVASTRFSKLPFCSFALFLQCHPFFNIALFWDINHFAALPFLWHHSFFNLAFFVIPPFLPSDGITVPASLLPFVWHHGPCDIYVALALVWLFVIWKATSFDFLPSLYKA